MNEFYQGVYAALGMLGGLCAFNYWMFAMIEKRLELKIGGMSEKLEMMNQDIHGLINELKEERRAKDLMYQFVLDSHKKK
jgi:hypothetical protein